jgi:hypothetical protein
VRQRFLHSKKSCAGRWKNRKRNDSSFLSLVHGYPTKTNLCFHLSSFIGLFLQAEKNKTVCSLRLTEWFSPVHRETFANRCNSGTHLCLHPSRQTKSRQAQKILPQAICFVSISRARK